MAPRHVLLILAVSSPLACNEGRVDRRDVEPAAGLAAGQDVSFARLSDAIEAEEVDLPRAIETAEAATGGTAIEARLALLHDGVPAYEVEIVADEAVHVIALDVDSFAMRSREKDATGAFDAVDADLAGRVDWKALVAAAEAETGGDAFDIETEGEDGNFEVEVLAKGVVWDVVLTPEGRVVRSTRDDGEWDDDQSVS